MLFVQLWLVKVKLFVQMSFHYVRSHSLQLGQMSYPDKILAESLKSRHFVLDTFKLLKDYFLYID